MIRPERPGDEAAIRAVEIAAFGRRAEADLVDRLRERGRHVLSLVALDEDRIVGHVLATRVEIEPRADAETPPARLVLGIGPVAVAPDRQRSGIGTKSTRAALAEARSRGAVAVVVLGHPAYYPRFGFVPARRFGLVCDYDAEGGAFFAQELVPGGLAGAAGRVRYDPEFDATEP